MWGLKTTIHEKKKKSESINNMVNLQQKLASKHSNLNQL